jgi:hypothetical protein
LDNQTVTEAHQFFACRGSGVGRKGLARKRQWQILPGAIKVGAMKTRDIFINCPFTHDYNGHFRAIVFTTIRSGFNPRCALETDDGAQNRFDKICDIIGQCSLGVHDISKTELDKNSKLPRFNMPLELGVFLAAKKFGQRGQKLKKCIIFDRAPYRYQAFISDIAGQDIHSHNNSIDLLLTKMASWLRAQSKDKTVPGGKVIANEFVVFTAALPRICKDRRLAVDELTYPDYLTLAVDWVSKAR